MVNAFKQKPQNDRQRAVLAPAQAIGAKGTLVAKVQAKCSNTF